MRINATWPSPWQTFLLPDVLLPSTRPNQRDSLPSRHRYHESGDSGASNG